LRLYNVDDLKLQSKAELNRKLSMVSVNEHLTIEERGKNIDILNFVLNGCVHHTRFDVLRDIAEQSADIDDFEV
jgi:hypothetical protein